jgi:hypothetical protein
MSKSSREVERARHDGRDVGEREREREREEMRKSNGNKPRQTINKVR